MLHAVHGDLKMANMRMCPIAGAGSPEMICKLAPFTKPAIMRTLSPTRQQSGFAGLLAILVLLQQVRLCSLNLQFSDLQIPSPMPAGRCMQCTYTQRLC